MTSKIDYESISNTPDQFIKAGYTHQFLAEPSGLYCAPLGLRLAPDEFDVVEVHDFDGGLSLKDGYVVYLISSIVGIKGTLMLAVSDVYSENMSFEMAQKLRMNPYGEWICS